MQTREKDSPRASTFCLLATPKQAIRKFSRQFIREALQNPP